ncbi:unnamed protein product, partial [Timema podura]|nr:unnamed protein product [Timema podura]
AAGGLHAEAGTPGGPSARAGLGGAAGSGAGGGLYSQAEVGGGGPAAAAGIGGIADCQALLCCSVEELSSDNEELCCELQTSVFHNPFRIDGSMPQRVTLMLDWIAGDGEIEVQTPVGNGPTDPWLGSPALTGEGGVLYSGYNKGGGGYAAGAGLGGANGPPQYVSSSSSSSSSSSASSSVSGGGGAIIQIPHHHQKHKHVNRKGPEYFNDVFNVSTGACTLSGQLTCCATDH